MSHELEEGGGGSADAAPFYDGVGPVTRVVDSSVAVVENAALWLAGLTIAVMMVITAISVVGGKLFGQPIPDDARIQGLLMVATIALPLAFVHRRDGHISVTITTNWLPPRILALLRLIGNVFGFVFFAIIWWSVTSEVAPNFRDDAVYDGVLELPYWPMKAVFSLAVFAFLLRLVFAMMRCVIDLVSGDAPRRRSLASVDAATLGFVILGATFGLLVVRVPVAFALGTAATLGIFLHFSLVQEMSAAEALRPTLSLVGHHALRLHQQLLASDDTALRVHGARCLRGWDLPRTSTGPRAAVVRAGVGRPRHGIGCRLRRLFRDHRFVGRLRRRHGPDRRSRNEECRLLAGVVDRFDCGGRNARISDPPVDLVHSLWDIRGKIDRAAVHRRDHSGPDIAARICHGDRSVGPFQARRRPDARRAVQLPRKNEGAVAVLGDLVDFRGRRRRHLPGAISRRANPRVSARPPLCSLVSRWAASVFGE